jgi:hypothetical protein
MTPPSRYDRHTSPRFAQGGILMIAALVLSGCVGGASMGSPCRTTEDTLANLRDGMTYRDVVQVIGCEGTIDRSGGQTTVARWSGPGQSAFAATIITFRNDRMVAFGVNGQ